jgi:hypothetical protein
MNLGNLFSGSGCLQNLSNKKVRSDHANSPRLSWRLPTRQMILDIVGTLLADRRQLKHLVLGDRIVGTLGKLPIHHLCVPKTLSELMT